MTHWLLSMSGLGQVSGLLTVYALMLSLRAPCLNDYNSQHIIENCVKILTTQISERRRRMEDLAAQQQCKSSNSTLPEITQYGIRLPFRMAVVGQTDSGKTHSIMHRWLGGKISYWRPNEDGS